MTQFRIIHLLKGKANPNTMNGVNKVVHNLASTQFIQGHDVQVWGITGSPTQIPHKHTYPLHLFSSMRNRFAVNPEMLAALDEVETGTTFHLHSVFLPELYAFSRQLKKRGFSWVISPHGGYAPESMKKNAIIKSIYKLLFENKLISGASAIHAIGVYGEADQFIDTKFKVGLVPNGYAPRGNLKENWESQGALRISYCGRLAIRHKGLDLLIEGMHLAIEQGVDVTLELIGDGPDRADLENMVRRLQMSHRVVFYGTKIGSEKDNLIIQADVFAHTSRWEGMPTSVLEAAGMGLPLLLSLPTNMTDYVIDASAGFVVSELTKECIAKVITKAAQQKVDGNLEKSGNAAREMILSQFSWPQIAALMDKSVYLEATVVS
jgi:glycosyltransferase involved in cell wall biosynthesis